MNKLYTYIVNNFIDTHCKFGLADFDTEIYKDEYVVYMYVDQIDDYNEFWAFNKEVVDKDIRLGRYKYVIKSGNEYYRSINILLSNYGLSQEELPIVYKMILETISMRLEEMEDNNNLNESTGKYEVYYEYIARILFDSYTKVYEGDDGIYVVHNGISHQLVSDCVDFPEVMSIPFDPRKYQVDWIIADKMVTFGITDVEEQRVIYYIYLDILRDNFCIDSPINESIDKETKLFNMLVDNFIDNYYRVSINHDSNEFEPQLYYNDELFWFITISNLVIWLKNGIDWSLNGELSSMHDFDDIFINYMVMYGIKDKKVIERFYDKVLRKLLDRVKEDIDKYENMGYDPL